MIPLAFALSILMGFTLGLLGGGGSILTVPILTLACDVPAKPAIATSLLVVGLTSLVALIPHARRDNVLWREGFFFAAFAMAGAYGAGLASGYLPARALLIAFSAIAAATGVAMLRPRREKPRLEAPRRAPWFQTGAVGLATGGVTGLVGAGGGFLIVPALSILGGLEMKQAVGTSLFVIALNAFAGFAGHYSQGHVDPRIAGCVVTAAVLGALVGARLAGRVPEQRLRRGFGVFVLIIAGWMLAREMLP
ncbi:MAG: sulfite exporter TauE/SafE family protein [Myxococcales bacterium]|nr:sulfite exporter TauE/SafE family protein [Myxococcales bacterium]